MAGGATMNDKSALYVWKEMVGKPLNDFVEAFRDDPPILAWFEPRPTLSADGTKGRLEGFFPLQKGLPKSKVTHPLDEVRLFWKTKALHALAISDNACRCFIYSDEPVIGWKPLEVRKVTGKEILLRRDWGARFGFAPTQTEHVERLRGVQVIEYRMGPALIAWRLLIDE